MTFSVKILGSNSALPTSERYPTAQILNVSERFFLIDCGEGTQRQLRKNKVKFGKINQIFISHLHGDHCFGLIGLISTFGLLGRTNDLHIFSHPDLEKMLQPQLDYFCKENPFKVVFHAIDPCVNGLIFEDKRVSVYTIPLIHRIPTCGFLFVERVGDSKIKKELIEKYNIPLKEIVKIKKGADFYSEEWGCIKNEILTIQPPLPRKYAFCTDTRVDIRNIPLLQGVDLLYHEATFLSDKEEMAFKTFHSTAKGAAQLAKDCNVKKLLLGHFSSRYKNLEKFEEEAREVFCNSFLAVDGSVFDVNR